MSQLSLVARVSEILLHAADEAIIPRFRQLAVDEIKQKAPDEVATAADFEAERIISDALAVVLPGARIVGEEASANESSSLNELSVGDIWVVDPLDGTSNFIKGEEPFAVMVALLRMGQPVLSVVLHPLSRTLYCAELGAGAYLGTTRVMTSKNAPDNKKLNGSIHSRFLPTAIGSRVTDLAGAGVEIVPPLMCVGAEYPRIAKGETNFSLYWRTLVWDHAPCSLFLTEAGGVVTRWDGSPYNPIDSRAGLIVSQNAAVHAQLKLLCKSLL